MSSLLEYLDRRLGRHTGSGPEYHYYCPACIDRVGSESNKRRFSINLHKKVGQCWRCEFRFRDMRHLFRYINGGYVTVEETALLRRDPPIIETSLTDAIESIFYPRTAHQRLRYHRLPDSTKPLTRENQASMPWKRAHQYLKRRGYGMEEIVRFDIRYAPRGTHAGHLIFPVYQGGQRVYWTTRYAGDKPPFGMKSKNPEKADGYVSKADVLLGYDDAVGSEIVALVEGPFDRMASPIPALASLGKALSDQQLVLIEGLVGAGLRELVLMYDEGTAEQTDEIRAALHGAVPVCSTLYLSGDPDELRQELPSLMRQRAVTPRLGQRLRSRFGR